MSKPEVTVFMAVYNGENYIRQSIESVLRQTFKEFELLIINDGSTDNSVSIIREFSDNRIRLVENEANLGLSCTRNKGIEEATGKYFATLDCDDFALEKRLELQLKYFYHHKDAALCAGRTQYINNNSKSIGRSAPLRGDTDYFKALLLFTNIFINSATMMNTSVLKKMKYRQGYEPAEDYDLFERMTAEYNFGIINDLISCYRVHDGNVSTIKSHNRKIAEKNIVERQLKRYGFGYTNDDLSMHLSFTTAEFNLINIEDCSLWFNSLAKQNMEKQIFGNQSFKLALARQWLRLCLYSLKTKHDVKPFFERGMIKYSDLIGSFVNSL